MAHTIGERDRAGVSERVFEKVEFAQSGGQRVGRHRAAEACRCAGAELVVGEHDLPEATGGLAQMSTEHVCILVAQTRGGKTQERPSFTKFLL